MTLTAVKTVMTFLVFYHHLCIQAVKGMAILVNLCPVHVQTITKVVTQVHKKASIWTLGMVLKSQQRERKGQQRK